MYRSRSMVSWSGGKDSCLATVLAVEGGAQIDSLLCMTEPGADRSRSHGLPHWLLQAQADALGCKLLTPAAAWADYEAVFVASLRGAATRGVGEMIFGDIDLQPHRDWEERVCAEAGIAASLPLWLWPRERVVGEVFARGIRAICVCVNTRFLSAEFCGRVYDASFVADLPDCVDACGENGEFHTCVVDAPLFRAPVAARVTDRQRYQAPQSQGGDVFWFAELAQART